MGAVGWQVGSPPLSLEECVKERATLHFRDGAMDVQSAGMKNDKNLAAHQPRCVPNHSRLAASHAEETTDDMYADQFLLECVWTGDRHYNTHACGGFPTRALCEREGRTAVASGELSSFNCVSAKGAPPWPANSLGGEISGGVGVTAIALDAAIGRGIAQPTAAGPGGSDQPTFGQQMPVRTAASAPDPNNMARNLPPPSPYPPNTHMLPGGNYGGAGIPSAYQNSTPPSLPPPSQRPLLPAQPAGINPGWTGPSRGWAGFEQSARPSTNIEDYRRTRGKPFIAQ
jgi:hypothetical protein